LDRSCRNIHRAAGQRTVLQEASLTGIFAAVVAGLAVSVLVSSYESVLSPRGVRFVPLDGLSVDLILTWAPGSGSEAVRAFRREMRQATPAGSGQGL
jgi:DNA-binding transcriptional LysR family regulator